MRKNLYLYCIPVFTEEPHFIRLTIRMELFWTFANILKDPVGTLFGGGPNPRQDSVVGVLSRLIVGLNEPRVLLENSWRQQFSRTNTNRCVESVTPPAVNSTLWNTWLRNFIFFPKLLCRSIMDLPFWRLLRIGSVVLVVFRFYEYVKQWNFSRVWKQCC